MHAKTTCKGTIGHAPYANRAKATLTVTSADGQRHEIRLRWKPFHAEDRTHVTGTVDGHPFATWNSVGRH